MAKEKLVVIATNVAKPRKEEELKTALLALIPSTQKEVGFIQYDLHQCHENPRQFTFYEIWEDAETLKLHATTPIMDAHKKRVADLIERSEIQTFKLIKG